MSCAQFLFCNNVSPVSTSQSSTSQSSTLMSPFVLNPTETTPASTKTIFSYELCYRYVAHFYALHKKYDPQIVQTNDVDKTQFSKFILDFETMELPTEWKGISRFLLLSDLYGQFSNQIYALEDLYLNVFIKLIAIHVFSEIMDNYDADSNSVKLSSATNCKDSTYFFCHDRIMSDPISKFFSPVLINKIIYAVMEYNALNSNDMHGLYHEFENGLIVVVANDQEVKEEEDEQEDLEVEVEEEEEDDNSDFVSQKEIKDDMSYDEVLLYNKASYYNNSP